ncbi:Ribosomal biogenesis methyltransferase EMG1/NEP1 [Trinorchestia longiramus]|nr:Ribosomal biogenesis methyltransferase EMG1/NEP1 [Trinorchestia longiramus]
MGKRKHEKTDEERQEEEQYLKKPAPHTVIKHQIEQQKRLIVVLERANLEVVKSGKHFELLNCDHHMGLIRKYKKDLADCRPDILHQCLLMLQDSPLNQAGLLQVFIHTEKNVLIEIDPQCRIPRTFKRFAGLMVQLLQRLSVRSSETNKKLLKVIKNPVTDHLPVGCRKIGTSFESLCVQPSELVPDDDKPIVIVVGAMAHGRVEAEYVEESFAISQYHLSGALACAKICTAFEQKWGVL